jgi:hypothetical protein
MIHLAAVITRLSGPGVFRFFPPQLAQELGFELPNYGNNAQQVPCGASSCTYSR